MRHGRDAVLSLLRSRDALRALGRAVVPLGGIFVFGWSALEVIGWYVLETVLIGLFNVPRILVAPAPTTRTGRASRLGLALFFLAHYGLFAAVQTGIVAGVVETGDGGETLFGFLADGEGLVALLAMLLGESASLLGDLRRPPEARRPADVQMFEPYTRIFVQQFAVLVAGFGLVVLRGAAAAGWLAVVLVAVRFAVDVFVTPRFRQGLGFPRRATASTP